MSVDFSGPTVSIRPGFNFKTSLLLRNRVQLFGGILIAVIFPALLRSALESTHWGSQIGLNTMGAGAAAIVLGYYLNRRMSKFPGVQANFYIAPIYVGCFALFSFAFLFSRIEYSRYLFFSSLAISIVWFYAVHILARRSHPLKLAVIPQGIGGEIPSLKGPIWSVLPQPLFPSDRIDGIVADLRSDMDNEWSRFITDAALAGVPVFHAKNVRESLTGRVEIDHLSENVFGSLVPGLIYLKLKFMLEWGVAVVASIFLIPVMLIIALLIRHESHGPIIFRQLRMGYRGKPFTMYKFRTMKVAEDVAASSDTEKTQTNDPRITRVGSWLRKHRLDELPQVFNILRGEMSWIGPRPEAINLSKDYEAELPYYRYRHIVRPGISGWAQVNQGHVAEVDDVHEKLYFDFYYIKHCSLWLDILIALRTVKTMVFGTGAK